MDLSIKEKFMRLWSRYFGPADLPITFYYTDDPQGAEIAEPHEEWHCLIPDLAKVRHGRSVAFSRESIGCSGGRHYAGFDEQLRPGIEHFLSCGIPGEMEGERYKQTPQLAREAVSSMPHVRAAGKYILFKRWDALDEEDEPQVAIFISPPDVLSGLFTLANYDETMDKGVVVSFSSGCGSILMNPYAQRASDHPRAFLGMFDVSARPYVPAETLSFAVPMGKFVRMIDNMDESFLITDSWKKVQERIERNAKAASLAAPE